MTLNIIDDVVTWLDHTFKDLEKFIETNFDNPLLWISIVVIVLLITRAAFNALSD